MLLFVEDVFVAGPNTRPVELSEGIETVLSIDLPFLFSLRGNGVRMDNYRWGMEEDLYLGEGVRSHFPILLVIISGDVYICKFFE